MTDKPILIVDEAVDPAFARRLADMMSGHAEVFGIDAAGPDGDHTAIVGIRRMDDGSHEVIDHKLVQRTLRARRGMSAMAMTGLMLAGVTEPEMLKARGIKQGGSAKQHQKSRPKAARANQRKIKQARKRNKGK